MHLFATELGCTRAGRPVFAGVSFAVRGGEALAVIGPNGAGKTSLLRMIAGLVPVAAGRLALEGGSPDLTPGEQAHYLGHQDAAKGALSVGENLRFWTSYLGGRNKCAALAALDLQSLADIPAAYLSAGQRRKLSVARLIAVPRPIWLLDEPNAALDAATQSLLSNLMRDHLGGGGMIIAATHGPLGIKAAHELRLGDIQGGAVPQSAGANA
jgi:heme exporter protein A